jgi:homoserine O-acetyltransferase/O-succinyltransferase
MNVPRLWAATLFLTLAAVPTLSSAQTKDTIAPMFHGQTEGDFIIEDFRFNNGEVPPRLRLHYVTLGTPHRNSSGHIDNAVLLLHSTGSDTTEFFESSFAGRLFGSGDPLDLSKFYLIIPDAIGHGRSSKPSEVPRHDGCVVSD